MKEMLCMLLICNEQFLFYPYEKLILLILYDLMKDNVTAMIKDSYFYFRCFFHVVICMYYRICSSY